VETLKVCTQLRIFLTLISTFVRDVAGYKYFADDLRAISRLRGTDLKKIHVLRTEMTESPDDMSQQFTFREIERVRIRNVNRVGSEIKC
jgi:hypothetical protein